MSNELTTASEKSADFELSQRRAKLYSSSALVPKEYQNNIANTLIALNMADRLNADPLMTMQSLYIVHGKPTWSAQFLISCFNDCGKYTSIKYKFVGKPLTESHGCIAYATELASGEVVEGPCVTIAMATAEGWVTKNGSKWKTMPELMLRYRAATLLVRTTAPQIAMGLSTRDEAEDIRTIEGRSRPVDRVIEPKDLEALMTEDATN